jgi:HlyD family secretion protein
MKSKLVKGIIIGLIVIGVGVGGYYGYNSYFAKKPVVSAAKNLTVGASKMNLEVSIQGTGSAYASSNKEVFPNNNGTIKNLSLKVGDTVTAGQKLFTSDSDELRSSVTAAQNNLSQQKLTLSSDQASEKVDENKIAKDNIAISEAKTQLSNANQKVSLMNVTAPIGGVITAVNNSNGDSAQSSKSVLTIVDMSSMKIKVSVDELDIGKIKIGQKSVIKFDALKDKSFEGAVEAIAETGTTSNNVTTYEVIVSIKDPSGIKLGMNANVNILVESKENALVIPAAALVEKNGEKFVKVESSDNSSSLVAIKTGIENENYIEITEGLKEGDKIQIQVSQSSSSSSNNNKNNMNGGFGGPEMGGTPPQGVQQGGPSGTQKN